MRPCLHLLAYLGGLAVVALSAACGAADEAAPVETTLTVWNRAQTELLALFVHPGADYQGAESLISEPLAAEAAVDVAFTQGQRVTVSRCPVPLADPVAFTTARNLNDVDGTGYTLIVFDRSFRLMSPPD